MSLNEDIAAAKTVFEAREDRESTTFHAAFWAEEGSTACTCQRNQKFDPDCELHSPEMQDDEIHRTHALRWWLAGFYMGQQSMMEVK